ncbi:50S ribosomal protein L17 [bacterium]|nr:50S ribosomal protein L17 [bacterium]MBL7052212.1 50S ribosomal protein L17 [Candidatus Neomarinimicrobiota bacterium]
MRHGVKKGRKLNKSASHRKAMLANMAASLFSHKRIRSTDVKLKELRSFVDKLITLGKCGDVHSRRIAIKYLRNKDAVKTLFDEIAPKCANRQGGYTRILKIGPRQNDAALVSSMELVDFSSDFGEVAPSGESEE